MKENLSLWDSRKLWAGNSYLSWEIQIRAVALF